MAICRVQGDEVVELKLLDSSETELLLPEGVYVLQCQANPAGYAVPALAELSGDSPLAIQVRTEPASGDDWCWIPVGPAIVGDTLGIGAEDERPARLEYIDGFWLATHEVTNAQYAEFLNQCEEVNPRWIDLGSRKCLIEASADGSFETDAADLPVVMVSLYGAEAYCQWMTETNGTLHRLPVEAEWEKAARGPESFVYSYGNIYFQAKANQESGMLKPVGSYEPNSYGLYDMTGNAFEWMSNQFDPESADGTMNQSLRGGSFVLDGMYLRNSFRMRQSKSVMTDDIGFRVLREESSD
ncbi:MAG: SUMF1/EgtB/PvdO family nonheme iron enzyme [Planctomycetota bacterium]